MNLDSAIEQAEKKKKIFDMMVSMHYKLRDDYNRWSAFFDGLEILTYAVFCGVTFYEFPQHFSVYVGFFSILMFALTLIKQRLDIKKEAEKHNLAGQRYLSAKFDLEQRIGMWKEKNEEPEKILVYIREKYQELAELISIPEKRFHKLKHHHQYKVEFSKFLDRNRSCPWLLCRLKFALYGICTKSRE